MIIDFEITDDNTTTYKNLLIRKDNLKKECEIIWISYIHELGGLIEELLNVKIECIALKKKIAYCKSKQNRNEPVVLSDMEFEIEAELSDYFDELKNIQTIKAAELSHLSEYEVQRVKKLYRRIAMMIHPDLHPDLFNNPEICELWNKAKDAYNINDYEQLKEAEFLIVQAIKSYADTEEKCEIENIDEKIEKLRKEIKFIVSSDPYRLKFLLQDNELLKEEKENLKEEIETYNNYREDRKSVV